MSKCLYAVSALLVGFTLFISWNKRTQQRILGDPGADSGGEGKSKQTYSPRSRLFFADIFRLPFRLSLTPTICPWVSEDDNSAARILPIAGFISISMVKSYLEILNRTIEDKIGAFSHVCVLREKVPFQRAFQVP